MSTIPGVSLLVLGPPNAGKSTLARKALEAEGGGYVMLAPGHDEYASYRMFKDNPQYIIRGYDDPEFFPQANEFKVEGFDRLIKELREAYAFLQAHPPGTEGGATAKVLVTDTFNSMSTLAMNKTYAKFKRSEAPPAMSPDGAAFWTYYRNLQESLMRICRAIRGCGLHWVATCHVAEKEMKEFGTANPEQASSKAAGLVPAISGGFRDVFPAAFDLVLYAGVRKAVQKQPDGKEVPVTQHYLRWQPDPKRPTKSRYGSLGASGIIPNDWEGLMVKLEEAA
jgi:hypothetical protein